MRLTHRERATLAVVACLTSTPACAEAPTDTFTQEGAEFRVTARRSPSQSWDLADITATRRISALTKVIPDTGPNTAVDTASARAAYGPANTAPQEDGRAADPQITPLMPDGTGHVPRDHTRYNGFFRQVGSSGTEVALLSGYVLAQGIPKLFKPTTGFHFKNEGWFGKDTDNIGMDKLTHAFNTYLIAELLHYRIHRNTGGASGDALTAGILASGMMALNEISDAIEPDSGYSMQDIAMNVAGATFSVLRNTVPGLKEKLAFKIEIVPNHQIYSRAGKPHYEQQRFMFALKGSGFARLERSPVRYLDLQVGYYASDFLRSDREKGLRPKRHLFVGLGVNLGELLFANSGSQVGKAAYSALDYLQLPYTSLRYDTTGRLGN